MSESSADDAEGRLELRKEALTTALYVALCLLAALTALPDASHGNLPVLNLVWGITIGLALAHWFAFRVAARLAGGGRVRRHDVLSGSAQLAGAGAIATLATIAVIATPESAEAQVVSLVLAGAIAAVGFQVARGAGAGRSRAAVYAAVVLLLAVVIVETKNRLSGH